jgi:hypothetical protein
MDLAYGVCYLMPSFFFMSLERASLWMRMVMVL